MPKSKTVYVCAECGQEFLKWSGKCDSCGSWNTLKELHLQSRSSRSLSGKAEAKKPVSFSQISSKDFRRLISKISEFDRTVGGGIVPGSVILLGGDPGIGKSTLILQVCEKISDLKSPISNLLYVSGEESAEQIKMRVDRLKIDSHHLQFLAETNIDSIVATIDRTKPKLVVIDSIQTMFQEEIPSTAGSVNQVRTCALKLIEIAKTNHLPIILIGHVTKGGEVAGPKTLEHLVDCVLYLEGERYGNYRILRGTKNRFGSTDEIGIFEMKKEGMQEVKNPSRIFIAERLKDTPGSVIGAVLEGSRTFLVEIQALTSLTSFGYPRRNALGFDFNRLQLLVAVLQSRVGLKLENQDVYLNVAGGFRIFEPAADLAVCLAIASAYTEKMVSPDLVAIGEVGLSGEIRQVAQIERRIQEAKKLGFKKILIPFSDFKNNPSYDTIISARTVLEAFKKCLK